MKTTKYTKSEFRVLTHKRYEALYTLVDHDSYKEAHSVSFPNLIHTTISSKKLTERSARTLGEMLIEIADSLKTDKHHDN